MTTLSYTTPRDTASVRAVAQLRGRRVRDADLGRLVQNRRLIEPIVNIPPAEAEEHHYASLSETAMAA